MKDPTYKFTCNLVVEPPKIDRFYMDLRVYSVVPSRVPEVDDDPSALVWRGIYLAFEVGSAADKS